MEAQKHLVRALVACSPKVTAQGSGIFLLDASGLQYLGGENKFCQNVLKSASNAGFTQAHVGIADSAFAAICASKYKHRRWYIVPEKKDAEFLGPLSIKHLNLSTDVEEALLDLGINSMSQLIDFNLADLSVRFGKEIVYACDLAKGLDGRRPQLPPQEKLFQCQIELGAPLASLSETLFILKSMLDRVTEELTRDGQQAEELCLAFINNTTRADKRSIKLICPANNTKFLLEIIKLSLEAKPPEHEFTGIALTVSRISSKSHQQLHINNVDNTQATDLLLPPMPPAHDALTQAMLLLIERFISRLGEKSLVRPVLNDQYLPEFKGVFVPVLQEPQDQSVLSVSTKHIEAHLGTQSLTTQLVLKKPPSPIPVLVELKNDLPVAVHYHHLWHHIEHITTPESFSTTWLDKAIRKSYYTTFIQSKDQRSMILLVCDHTTGNWSIEGFFD